MKYFVFLLLHRSFIITNGDKNERQSCVDPSPPLFKTEANDIMLITQSWGKSKCWGAMTVAALVQHFSQNRPFQMLEF